MGKLKINHVAVWILVVVHQIIAVIWYAEFLFGKKWMQLLNKIAEDFQGASPLNYVIAIITAIVMTYMIAWLFTKINVDNGIKGLQFGFAFGVSFFFLQVMTQGFFSMRPFGLTLIDGGMYMVNFIIAGIVLGVWKKYQP